MHTEKELQAAREYAYSHFTKYSTIEKIQQEAHLAGQRYAKENAWIRVDSGELPENRQRCFICINKTTCESIYKHGQFYDSEGMRAFLGTPTHWQPLPTPPKD